MSIRITCDSCFQTLTVKDDRAGRRVRCPECGEPVHVPSKGARSSSSAPRPSRSGRASSRRSSGGGQSSPMGLAIGAGAAALLIVVGLVAYTMARSGRSVAPADSDAPLASLEAAAPPVAAAGAVASPAAAIPAAPRTVSVPVHTDFPGATLSVRDPQSGAELQRVVLAGDEMVHVFDVQMPGSYEFQAEIAGRAATAPAPSDGQTSVTVNFNFTAAEIKQVCKAGTCMVRMPGGGHGSGFLLGDRQTIATAAHVVSTPKLDEIEVVFDPDDAAEEVLQGVRLVYFDADLDVAVLSLPEPAAQHRPYLLPHRLDRAEKDQRLPVFVIGNPGIGDDYEPLYVRDARVVAQRPDEFEVDIELKPGNSGGPVCTAEGGRAVGLVSYKIVTDNPRVEFEDRGRSFCKSVAIADDARLQWLSLSPDQQQSRVERIEARYARTFGYQRTRMAAANLMFDGGMYYIICRSVTQAHRIHMANARRELLPTARPRVVKSREERAHKEFVTDVLPGMAKEVRDKVSAQLKPETDKWYEEAIADASVPDPLKEDLKQAHELYLKLKDAAEQLSSGDPKGGLSRDEFERSVADWLTELYRVSQRLIGSCTAALRE